MNLIVKERLSNKTEDHDYPDEVWIGPTSLADLVLPAKNEVPSQEVTTSAPGTPLLAWESSCFDQGVEAEKLQFFRVPICW
jgi:hypothetical protein